MPYSIYLALSFTVLLVSCNAKKTETDISEKPHRFTGSTGEIRLMTLDPGHFHASLVQKYMYEQVDPLVHVYAPAASEVEEHLKTIQQFNTRPENPTAWEQKVYRGPDYLDRMLQERPGNVLILAGNNARKTSYIHAAVRSGINVLADKPMVINPDSYPLLLEAFELANQHGVLLYDIMTERFEISTILQRELSRIPAVFGELEQGTLEHPAISKESVHHFFKDVAGKPLKRPPWFFDIEQEGAGIVDVSTHLVDLIFWECFPEQPINQDEVEVLQAKRWATTLTPEEFAKVTGMNQYPDYLSKYLTDDALLNVFSNGEFVFTTKGIYGKVSVIWNFQAPEGAKDTHYSMMRGSRANLVIRQDQEQQYVASLFVEPSEGVDKNVYQASLEEAIQTLNKTYPGLTMKPTTSGWEIMIPDQHRVGHEAHFKQVTEKYLKYLQDGKLPEWELKNMLTKYYVTMQAYTKSL